MLVLASQSPRRAELLTQIGIPFKILPVDIDESPLSDESAQSYVLRLAQEKSQRGWIIAQGEEPVLGADTVVVIGDQILGKPQSQSDSIRMLSLLSGQTHRVLTAVAVTITKRQVSCIVSSLVRFASLTEQQMRDYWLTGEPADKAGSYAIQGLGGQFVEHINGSYSGIVGLPLFETKQLLNEIGYFHER
jgi:septum formation protein